jgi:repressor LexA
MADNTIRPTKKQRELLDYIEAFITEHGYSPSYREIMNGCQYNSVATVALHVGSLIKRGHLRKRDHSARSLEVVRNVGEAAAAGDGSDQAHEQWLLHRVETHLLSEVPGPADGRGQERRAADSMLLLEALRILGLTEQVELLQTKLAGLIDVPLEPEKAV